MCKDENVGIVIFNKHTRVWYGSIHWVSRYGSEYLRLKVLINAPPISINEGKKGWKSRAGKELKNNRYVAILSAQEGTVGHNSGSNGVLVNFEKDFSNI